MVRDCYIDFANDSEIVAQPISIHRILNSYGV